MKNDDNAVIPIIDRKVKNKFKNKNTLLNYFIQNLQLKYIYTYLQQLLNLFEKYQSKVILYLYDSVLMDIKRDQFNSIYTDIKQLNDKF